MTSTRTADVTAVVLTRDAVGQLAECLQSLQWVVQVVAVDAGSTDGTRELIERSGAMLLDQDQALVRAHAGNFDVARNPAFDRARSEWILVVDADEVVTAELREQLVVAMAAGERIAFEVPRFNLYWGGPSRILGEDHQLRLFPRGAGRYRGNRLDRPVEVDCPVRRLSAPLLHRQTRLLRKLRERTDQRARRAVRDGEVPRESSLNLFRHHLRWYMLQQEAWREGPRGWALAALYAAYPALEAYKARRLASRLAAGS